MVKVPFTSRNHSYSFKSEIWGEDSRIQWLTVIAWVRWHGLNPIGCVILSNVFTSLWLLFLSCTMGKWQWLFKKTIPIKLFKHCQHSQNIITSWHCERKFEFLTFFLCAEKLTSSCTFLIVFPFHSRFLIFKMFWGFIIKRHGPLN